MIRQPEGGFLLASVGGLLVERDGRALTDAGAGPLTMGPPLNTYGVMTGGALLDNLAALGRGPAGHRGDRPHPPARRPRRVGPAPRPRQRPARLHRRLPCRRTRVDPASLRRSAGHGRHDQGPGVAGAHRGRGRGDLPGVHIRFTPGHSAGHAAYVIDAGGQWVIAFGDAFHSPSRSATRSGRTPSTSTTSSPPACAPASSRNSPSPTRSDSASTSPA